MTRRITAIKAMQPKIKLRRSAEMSDLIDLVTRRTGLGRGEIYGVTLELVDAILHFARQGQAIKIEGLGIFTPSLKANGDFQVNFRADVSLRRALNTREFWGEIENKRNIGKNGDELVALWDEDHPDDPVEE